METLFREAATIGEQIIQFSWVPLLIWTVFSGIVWAALRSVSSIHPQYQYHGRLALLFGLPAGFVMLGLIQVIGNLLLPSPTESLAIISVTAPFEMTVTPNNSATVSTTDVLYFASFVLLAIGLILFLLRNGIQWFRLQRLQSRCTLSPIQDAAGIDNHTIELIKRTNKNIQISFLDEEIVPVTFGIKKPIVLVPNSIKYDSEKLNLVLRHELTHIAQNDFLSNIVITITQIVFWFHPFVHLLKRELIDYREIRCDSLVLSNRSVSRKKYASLLLELLPMPNVSKELSVNMAQESSNLKKRIHMITQQTLDKPIPKRSSIAIFAFVILSTVIAMSCTDMQTQNVFDEEELDLMTDIDRTGERGFHQILIFMGDDEQSERHQDALDQLNQLQPEYVREVEVLKGDAALEQYGERASEGVIIIKTKLDPNSYNTTLRALGMEEETIKPIPADSDSLEEDFFVVVEEMPELIGGLAELQQKIRYPEMARRAGIEGRVYVQFIVTEQGDVDDARIIRGIGGGADQEALRVVKEAKFTPGYQRGKPVRVQYSLPIFFRLESDETNGDETSSNLSKPDDDEMTVVGYAQAEIENPEVNYSMMEIDVDRTENSIEGTITDSESGEPLPGANIVADGSNLGTTTDMSGKFTLSTENSDISQLSVSYVGYRSINLNL